jgi:hypothetical protein
MKGQPVGIESPAPEIAIGYSLFAGLVYLTIAVLRRTREIDNRRDKLANAEKELAQAREHLANADRARLEAEISKLTNELWKIRFQLDARLNEDNHHVD